MSHAVAPNASAHGDARTSLSLHDAAVRIGGYRWTHMRLFEALGSWATTARELEAKLMFGRHCHHHAWHADLWEERLPDLSEPSRDQLTAPPDAAFELFVSAVTQPDDSDHTADLLVGVYRVLVPRCIAAYTEHRARASAVADGPTIRVLNLVLRDLVDDWVEGEVMIQSIIDGSEGIERVTQRQARLEVLHSTSVGLTHGGAHTT